MGMVHLVTLPKPQECLTYAPTQTGIFADFNRDGWIDLFVGNESRRSDRYPSRLVFKPTGWDFQGECHRMRLECNRICEGFNNAGDINNDGWPDIFLSLGDDFNQLWLNKGAGENGLPDI